MPRFVRVGAISAILGVTVCTANLSAQVNATQVPLAPKNIPQFVDPLPHFAGARVSAAGGNLTVRMLPSQQRAVSTGTVLAPGATGLANVWTYSISNNGVDFTPPLWPAFTVEAQRGVPVTVTYENMLGGETYTKVGLVVDQTLHWANPAGFATDGPVPAVVHLHGGEVPAWSDGGPDAWFTPGGAQKGHAAVTNQYYYPNDQEAATLWYHDHGLGVTRLNVYAGMAGFYFLRGGAAEDALHLPGWSGDDKVQEVLPPGKTGTFNPSPYLPEIEIAIQDRMFDTNGGLYFPNLPTNPAIHPVWTPEFLGDVITVNGRTWPYLSVAPRKYRFRILNGSNARFYALSLGKGGPAITQIGTDGGFLETPVSMVFPAKLLIAPGERADVIIDFSAHAGKTLTLDNSARAPFPKGTPPAGSTTGRIMQFVVNGLMVSSAPPAAGLDKSLLPNPIRPAAPVPGSLVKLTDFLGAPAPGVTVAKTRLLTLNEVMGMGGPLEVLVNNTKYAGHGVDANGAHFVRTDFTPVPNGTGTDPIMDFSYYSENVNEGETEVWKIVNLTADAHPMHLHLVQYQLVSRQPFDVGKYNKVYNALFPGGLFIGGYGPPKDYTFYATAPNIPATGAILGGNPDVTPFLKGAPVPPNPNERGWKDTFIMYPGEVTTVIVRFAPTTPPASTLPSDLAFSFDPNGGHGYVWHCHIVDHEDNEMMRPYSVATNTAIGARLPASIPPWSTFGSAPVAAGSAVQSQAEETAASSATAPVSFGLSGNYPNPFNPETRISFSLPQTARVLLKVYNSLGEEVATLADGVFNAGSHTVRFSATGLPSGTYIARIQAGGSVAAQRMLLLK